MFRILQSRAPQLKNDLTLYASVQVDRARLVVAQAIAGSVALIFWMIIGAVVVATGTVMLLFGISGGLTTVLDGRTWLANIITGGLTLASILVVLTLRRLRERSLRFLALKKRYARPDTEAASEPISTDKKPISTDKMSRTHAT